MNRHVTLKRDFLIERAVTIRAYVWLFTRVHQLVSHQVASIGERSAAGYAHVVAVAGVRFFVFHETRPRDKSLPADFANVRANGGVPFQNVSFEVDFHQETTTTCVAQERFAVGMFKSVYLQITFAFVTLATGLADVRKCFRVHFLVRS